MIWMLAAGLAKMVGAVAFAAFVFAQGAAIFMTAFIGLRVTGATHWSAKAVAMVVSYAGWVALTYLGYLAMGGESTIQNGANFLQFAFSTALASSAVFYLMWAIFGRRRKVLR